MCGGFEKGLNKGVRVRYSKVSLMEVLLYHSSVPPRKGPYLEIY